MVSEFVRKIEGMDPVFKEVCAQAADAAEVALISTVTFFGWTAAVNHAADKKLAEAKAAETKKAEDEKKPEAEVVDKDGKPAK